MCYEGTRHPAPAPAPATCLPAHNTSTSTGTSNLSPPRAQPAYSTKKPVSTTCTASSQHQHRHPAPSTNVSPPRAQPAHTPAPAPGTQHRHQQPVSTVCTVRHQHQHRHPATCLHHVHRQLTAPAPAPAPSTSNLSRKRARATHCYLEYKNPVASLSGEQHSKTNVLCLLRGIINILLISWPRVYIIARNHEKYHRNCLHSISTLF